MNHTEYFLKIRSTAARLFYHDPIIYFAIYTQKKKNNKFSLDYTKFILCLYAVPRKKSVFIINVRKI